MNKEEIIIDKAIIHILDSEMSIPVLSDNLLLIDDEVKEFLQAHIHKVIESDDMKFCKFIETDTEIFTSIINISKGEFINSTKIISNLIFDVMIKNVDIPSGDMLFITFSYKGTPSLAMLKLNYKQSFIHFVEREDTTTLNKIIKHRTILPSDTQKLNEAIIINLVDYSIKLIEKQFEINGKKDYYLSKLILNCTSKISPKAKLNIINKTVDQINKKYYEDDVEKKMEFKKAIYEEISEKGEIDVQNVADKVFKTQDINKEFKDNMDKYGLLEEKVQLNEKRSTKKFESQTIKTDAGIEISIPVGHYNDTEKLEFINNPDGTISILIKKVMLK